jgi:hypothetical protein
MAADRTNSRVDPTGQIPEADLLEQQTPLDPQSLTTLTALTDPDTAPPGAGAGDELDAVDEADRMEQQTPMPDTDEDDYPHDIGGP